MGGDLGILMRARTEQDAELFLLDRAERGRRRPRTRRETWVILVLAVVLVLGWGVAVLVG